MRITSHGNSEDLFFYINILYFTRCLFYFTLTLFYNRIKLYLYVDKGGVIMALNMGVIFDEKENKWVFSPDGEIDIYTYPKFKEEILKYFNSRQTDILIDGGKLDYIDSTGLGALISILKNLRDNENKIYLSNVKPNIRKLFSITELDKLFIIRGENDE